MKETDIFTVTSLKRGRGQIDNSVKYERRFLLNEGRIQTFFNGTTML